MDHLLSKETDLWRQRIRWSIRLFCARPETVGSRTRRHMARRACPPRLPKRKTGILQHRSKRCRTPPPAPHRGHSSVGRASALQAECRRSESDCLHQRAAQAARNEGPPLARRNEGARRSPRNEGPPRRNEDFIAARSDAPSLRPGAAPALRPKAARHSSFAASAAPGV